MDLYGLSINIPEWENSLEHTLHLYAIERGRSELERTTMLFYAQVNQKSLRIVVIVLAYDFVVICIERRGQSKAIFYYLELKNALKLTFFACVYSHMDCKT